MARSNPDADVTQVAGADGAPAGTVPRGLIIAAAYAWRLIVVGVVLMGLATLFNTLTTIVLPLIIAILIAAPLERLVTRLHRLHVPRGLGAGLVLLGLILVVLGLVAIAGTTVVAGFSDLRDQAVVGFNTFLDWLTNGPLNIAQEQIDGWVAEATKWLQANWVGVANGAVSVTGHIGSFFASIVIMLLALYFFLRDGRTMWLWFARTFTGRNAAQVDNAGRNAWITLRRYTQTSAFVALVDAVGIGIAAWLLGLPLAFTIGIMVFLFSFIPMFGATISGAVAVLVALVDGGWVTALIMLAAVVLVQQIEGSILYPWLFGKAMDLHPIVILVAVSSGTLLAGLFGAVVAVPLVAFAIAFVQGLKKEYEVKEPPSITAQLPRLHLRERTRSLWRRTRSTTPAPPSATD